MPTSCQEEARRWVHRYAAGGAAFAVIPLPFTSAGLATLEAHLVSLVGTIYGDPPGELATSVTGGTFAVAGHGLKWAALQGAALVPAVGPLVRAGIAFGVIEAIGHAAIGHFERKYPGRPFEKAAAA